MTQPPSDERLRQAHDALLAARSGVVDLPDVSVETIAALAQGTYREPDRILLLDRILAHPVTARELQFFRELAAAAPAATTVRHLPARRLALAAAVVLTLGGVSVWRALSPGGTEPVRGERPAFALAEPADGSIVGGGARLVWRTAPGATSYRLELVDDGGAAVFSTTVNDTLATLPDSLRLASGRRYQLRLVALLRDGTDTTAPVATLIAR